ncbi:hypothetical protein [Hymenobacter perfusus]|uniref:Lipoprotein n=1 Tax=Hymenobacter perfusus TaxID=1236770 RepID=A0A428KEB9_9BACT|nr:hypothetical protein [Hymenobacter perfusus]RSK44724.1 hypothetical protein EI293_09440 [Hymenobacter perfusus]
MRNFLVLLLGSFALLLATACNRPAPPSVPSVPVEYFYQQYRASPVPDSASAAAKQQTRVSQVTTPSKQVAAPSPRFYTRWRRVHGRWYHFTYRVGDKRAMVQHPDPGWRITGPQKGPHKVDMCG